MRVDDNQKQKQSQNRGELWRAYWFSAAAPRLRVVPIEFGGTVAKETYAHSRCQDEVMNSSAYRFYSGALILPRRVTKWMRIVAAHRLIIVHGCGVC